MQAEPYREIPLRAHDGAISGYTKVSPEDYDALTNLRWYRTLKGYAKRQTTGPDKKRRTISMARLIMGLPDGDPRVADHINRDKLDNRRSNLRILTEVENRQNVPARGGSSEHRGVTFHRATGKWMAKVAKKHLGVYDTEAEAAAAARVGRMLLFPYAED